tara:strand:- start:1045 stop:1455 length:411 start_codon:yes stop_codon:yes gene_type:complete
MKKIVVIAHNRFKADLLSFLKERESWFYGREIVATGRTAVFLEAGGLNLPLDHVKKGDDGGYLEIIEMIKKKDVGMVFFFRDAEIQQSYHPDIQGLLDSCDRFNVPISTNQAAAELLIIGLIRMEAADEAASRIQG